MPSATNLSRHDHANLARVAQGQATLVDDAGADRLIAAGLIVWMKTGEVAAASLQLTPTGLALIRSSDQ